MIYFINNPIAGEYDFVVPDQATEDAGIALGYEGIYHIGDQSLADAILVQNQQAWLNQNASLFTTSKDIDVDPIQTTWIVCDLNTEPDNTDVDYNIFDVVNGYYNLATGLNNAKAKEQEVQQNYLAHCLLDHYQSYAEWPPINPA